MKIMLFGATGMVGQGVLHECLAARDVERVITIGRTAGGQSHLKLEDIVQADLYDYSSLEDRLRGIDACFFCLGVSSPGMSESTYSHVTYDITVAAAQTLSGLNPRMTFVYVSGAGTDSSEQGRSMWAGQGQGGKRPAPHAVQDGVSVPSRRNQAAVRAKNQVMYARDINAAAH